MSTNLVRKRFSAVAVKHESTGGTDVISGTPAAADWIGATCDVQFDPDVIDLDEYTGSMDRAASIVGGLKPRLTLRIPVRGSGAAATVPKWGELLQCCTMALTATGSAVGAPTAAASGTTTTVTAASPFGTTLNQYRGMALSVTGDQTFITGIMDYTTSRVITMGETRTALTTSSLLQIPINNLYSPSSDESVYKTATCYFYADGVLWIFVGCSGTWSLEITTGGLAFITFELRAVFSAKSATSLPAGAATAAATRALVVPPRLVAGKIQLDKVNAQAKTVTLNAGVDVQLPDDPEGADGYGAAVPVARDVTGNLNPYINTSTTVSLFNKFRAGTSVTLMALIGSTAGNRFLISAPAVKAIGMDPGARNGFGEHGYNFQADGADASAFICSF